MDINLYDILEIPKNADKVAIKKAYRKQAKRYHPDRNPNDQNAGENFKLINKAFLILYDDEKRYNYDTLMAEEQPNTLYDFYKYYQQNNGEKPEQKPKRNAGFMQKCIDFIIYIVNFAIAVFYNTLLIITLIIIVLLVLTIFYVCGLIIYNNLIAN